MLAVLEMLDRENARIRNEGKIEGKIEGEKEGKKKGILESKIYNIPINVDTIKEGCPILCA